MGEWLLERIAARRVGPAGVPMSFGRPLLLVGEPGVGKTVRAEVIAKALGLPSFTLPLAGLHDALSLRGVRSLYDRAEPGMIASALAATGSMRCVLIGDELDKLGHSDTHGDPADALLHAVDPRQARSFRDDFLEFPLDLGDILFVSTANDPAAIRHTLLDRHQVIEVPPYTRVQKRYIVSRDLAARRCAVSTGCAPARWSSAGDALEALLERHELEPGLRQMETSLRTLCLRAAAAMGKGTRPLPARRQGTWPSLLGAAQGDDFDQCAVCGSPILEPSDAVRFLGSALPHHPSTPAVPLSAHQRCLRRPTSYFLGHRHDIEARVAAESVIWRWMTGPRDVEEPPGSDGAEVTV